MSYFYKNSYITFNFISFLVFCVLSCQKIISMTKLGQRVVVIVSLPFSTLQLESSVVIFPCMWCVQRQFSGQSFTELSWNRVVVHLSRKIDRSSLLTLIGNHWYNWNVKVHNSWILLKFTFLPPIAVCHHHCWLHCFAVLAESPRNYCSLDGLSDCIFKRGLCYCCWGSSWGVVAVLYTKQLYTNAYQLNCFLILH